MIGTVVALPRTDTDKGAEVHPGDTIDARGSGYYLTDVHLTANGDATLVFKHGWGDNAKRITINVTVSDLMTIGRFMMPNVMAEKLADTIKRIS